MNNLFLTCNKVFKILPLIIETEWLGKKLDNFFESKINNNGNLFIYNNYSGVLYFVEFKVIEEMDKINKNKVSFIKTENKKHFIYLISFKPIPYSSLKHLYSQNKKGFRNYEKYSIYNTLKEFKFPYALPYIKDSFYQSINYKKNKNYLRGLVLYDDNIIPSKDKVNYKSKSVLKTELIENSSYNKIYGKVIEEDNHYIVTLTNKKMIELDFMYLDYANNESFEFYKPYFYEFIVDEKMKEKVKEFISSNIEEGYYEIELSTGNNLNDNDLYSGELLFSASPSIRTNAFLKFIKTVDNEEILKNINQLKSSQYSSIKYCDNISIISNRFESLTKTPHSSMVTFKITIYNVGQGNWIKIEMYSDGVKVTDIVFDIGRGLSSNNKNRNIVTKKAASQLDINNFFILSHWDMDHIEAVNDLEYPQFLKSWFVPNIKMNSSNSAFRLAAFLNLNRNVTSTFISEKLNSQVIVNNDYFTLGKGKGMNINKKVIVNQKPYYTHYNDKNNLGLVLEIKGANENFLLTGDCEYIQLPNGLRKPYDYITASHHGAVTELDNLILPKSRKRNGEAIACVGKNPDYPKSSHVDALKLIQYNVKNTRDFTISINYIL